MQHIFQFFDNCASFAKKIVQHALKVQMIELKYGLILICVNLYYSCLTIATKPL